MKNYAIAIAALVMAAVPANAITYVGSRSVGAATAQVSITTDNTLGAVGEGNITDWTIAVSDASNSFVLNSGNSSMGSLGAVFFATATDLFFDFDTPSHGIGFFDAGVSNFYCLTTPGVTCNGLAGETITVASVSYTALGSGNQIIASVASVPEPASWAMMIGGLAITGAAMRRRKVAVRFA